MNDLLGRTLNPAGTAQLARWVLSAITAIGVVGCGSNMPDFAPFGYGYIDTPPNAPRTAEAAIEQHFSERPLDPVEGVWTLNSGSYQLAIYGNDTGFETHYAFVGVVINSSMPTWRVGRIKLMLDPTSDPDVYEGLYFGGDHTRFYTNFRLSSPNVLRVYQSTDEGIPSLSRDYPATRSLTRSREAEDKAAVRPTRKSQGTCFAVSPNGILVTSNHVVEDSADIAVRLADGNEHPAKIISRSAINDIAVLKIDTSTRDYLSLASTRSVHAGQPVFTLGFPLTELLGDEPKFSEGSISALSGLLNEASYMQISVPIQPGNSGGPLLNLRGEVVGIIVATAAVAKFYNETGTFPQNISWAVKSDFIQPMIENTVSARSESTKERAIGLARKAICQVVALS